MDFDSLQDDSAAQPQGGAQPQSAQPASAPPSFDSLVDDNDKYSTPGQQAMAGVEGVGEGVLGPIAPAIERGLGVDPADIRGRAAANPITSGVGKAVGFGGSMLTGVGEGALVGHLGEAAAHAAGLGLEGAGAISKIAASGVRGGAEMAALQTGDEISKVVTQDPNASLGQAAINIGLSGVLGGAGGAVLGAVSPLWQSAKNAMGVSKLASDFMGETKAIQEAGDPLQSATSELSGRMSEADQMRTAMSETKPEVLAKAMPDSTPENAAKIDAQIQEISDKTATILDSASKSVKTKSAVPFLAEDLNAYQDAVTNPDATFADKFIATNKLKQTLDTYQKFSESVESTARGQIAKEMSAFIRPALEDTKVWGAAGDVQRVTNEATTNVIRATKDMRGQVTSNLMGENSVAPEKVQTLLNQANAGKVARKAAVVENYLDYTQKQADAINKVHLDNGLEPPLATQLNPTPIINHALNTEITPGVALARWANRNGSSLLGKAVGEAGAGVVGGGLGAMVGHPLVGAWMGEKVLAPVFSALAKPLAENAINSTSAKASVDYVGNVIKGTKLLGNATANMFKAGAEVLPREMIPDTASRDKLQKSLDYAGDPKNMMNIGGSLGHYMPDHATAAASLSQTAVNYLNGLKPKQVQNSPLDKPSPVDKFSEQKYNRQLDIAQQPLLALKYAKEGSLQPQDIQTLNTIYPGLVKKIASQSFEQMTKSISEGNTIPYKQRASLSLLIGQPLDSTMTVQGMQSIIMANAPKMPPMPQGKPSKATANSMQKTSKMLATPAQAREADKTSG